MEYFGINWQIGRPWGNHHPEHNCWNSPESVKYEDDTLCLGVDYKPVIFDVPDRDDPGKTYKKRYPWSVGYVTSTDSFKYGYFRVEFKLPLGKQLWPAIWLSDRKTWPPEIDIVEGWSDQYNWLIKPKSVNWIYRINPLANRIFPSVHTGTNPEEHRIKSYKKFNGTPSSYIDITGRNVCELIWAPDRLVIYYNGRKVMEETRPEILKYYNESSGMNLHLNNYVTNNFHIDEFIHMNDRKDTCKWFYIFDIEYNSDYESKLNQK
jgi:hypothetical protein